MSLLDAQMRKHVQANGGAVAPDQGTLNFEGPGVAVIDDPTNLRTRVVLGGSDGGLISSWSVASFTPQTSNADLVLGGSGTATLRTRNCGGDREVEARIKWGSSPTLGTGDLLIPLAADLSVSADAVQLILISGVGDVRAWSWGPNATPATILSPQNGTINSGTTVHFLISAIPFRTPQSTDIWFFKFSCPRVP